MIVLRRKREESFPGSTDLPVFRLPAPELAVQEQYNQVPAYVCLSLSGSTVLDVPVFTPSVGLRR